MSACVPADRILQTLKVSVPGATDDMLKLQLFNVTDEFFRRTSAWRYHQDVTLEENVNDYVLGIPAGTQIVRFMSVEHQDVPVAPAASVGAVQSSLGVLSPELTFMDGDSAFHFDDSDIGPTNIFTYAVYRPGYITVTGLPDDEGRKFPLRAVLALTLARSCLECDCDGWAAEEWMWDMFFQDWLDGTLSRMYAMPSKPWSNLPAAVYHGKRFRNAMAYRKQEAVRGFTYGVPAWRFPRGWV